MLCKICRSEVAELLVNKGRKAVTSLGRLVEGNSAVYMCESCSHCQTDSGINFEHYYSSEYKSLLDFPEEDDIYKIENNNTVYRSEFMAKNFLGKILCYQRDGQLPGHISVLDYGCGKGLFAKALLSLSDFVECWLYDISDDYLTSWSDKVPRDQSACFDIPEGWAGKFDVITSLLSLEHVCNPVREIDNLRSLLAPSGFLYILVPNMYSENKIDMLVADHIHHYSPLSMKVALSAAGFDLLDEDHASHSQCSIYLAKRRLKVFKPACQTNEINEYIRRQKDIAYSFGASFDRLEAFARSNKDRPCIVIGAGVIGSLVASLIDGLMQISCFVDSNKFKQKKGWLGYSVVSPADLGKHIENLRPPRPVYVIAMNSKMAPIGLTMVPGNAHPDDVFRLFPSRL